MKNRRVLMILLSLLIATALTACGVPTYYQGGYTQGYGQNGYYNQYPQQVYPQQQAVVPAQPQGYALMANPVITGLAGAAIGAGVGSWLTNRHSKKRLHQKDVYYQRQMQNRNVPYRNNNNYYYRYR